MAFYTSIRQWWQDVEDHLDKSVRATKIAVYNQVAINTRVDTGRLAGNWQVSNHQPERNDREVNDKSHSIVKGEIAAIVKGTGIDSFLSNNLDYAPFWNEFDGYVDLARAFFPQVVRKMKKPS